MYFTLSLYSLLPEKAPRAHILLDSGRTQISFETVDPGGFSSLTVGMPSEQSVAVPGVLPQEHGAIDFDQHVELRFAGGLHVLWEGQIVELDRGAGGLVTGFIAEGYGISGMDDASLTLAGSTALPNGVLLQTVLPFLSTYLVAGNGQQFIDPAGGDSTTVGHTLNDFANKNLEQIVTSLMNEGDGRGTPWRMRVWEDQAVWFLPYSPPATPDYAIPWDDRVTQWKENGRNRRTSVQVSFVTGQTAVYSDPSGARNYRPRGVVLDGGTLTTTGAGNWAQVYLADHVLPEYGIELTCTLPAGAHDLRQLRGLENAAGVVTPPWLVRAGQWVTVAGYGPFAITRTTLDATAPSLTVKLGDYWLDEIDLWRDMRNDQAKLRRRIHPVSGGTY